MLQRKRANFIENIRRNHHQQLKRNMRKQIFSRSYPLPNQSDIQFPQVKHPSELPNCHSETLQQENEADFSQKQQLTLQLIQKFRCLMEDDHNSGNQLDMNVESLVNLMTDLRLIILNGKNLVKFQFVGQLFGYLKAKMQLRMHKLGCIKQIQNTESQRDGLLSANNLLDLTLIMLVSQYLNQGGEISQNLISKNWLVREFYNWSQSLETELAILLQIQEDYKQELFKEHLLVLEYYLLQLAKMVETIQYYSTKKQCQQLIICLFSQKIMKKMIVLMRSYHTPLQIQIFLTSIFNEMGETKNTTFFRNLVASQFLQFARLHLFIYDQYKAYSSKAKVTAQISQQAEVITNILYILSQISTNYSSDLVWSSGIAQEVKCILPQIQHPVLRQDFITFLLCSIVTVNQYSTIKLVNDASMMEWVLSILYSRRPELKFTDFQPCHPSDTIVGDCMIALRFFFGLGKAEMQNCSELSQNPYVILFKYLRGQQIIRYFQEGQQLLSKLCEFNSL